MSVPSLAAQIGARIAIVTALAVGAMAFARNPAHAQTPSAPEPPTAMTVDGAPVPPGTTPADVAPAPGLPGPASVDPAPGAAGPYAGHSERAFYDVDDRIRRVSSRIDAMPKGAARARAEAEMASIRQEEKDQIARHGDLLDWARENLNRRLDRLEQSDPSLKG